MADPSPAVLYDCRDGVGLITFNRPQQLNSWGLISIPYFDALDQAAADPACRVIVVAGSGKAWCAGADVVGQGKGWDAKEKKKATPKKTDAASPSSDAGARIRNIDTDQQGRWVNHAQHIPKLVIACVNGAVAGGGFAQILNCDVRFAAAGVAFASAFARRGLIAEFGVSQTLAKVAGTGVAMDLLISGRKIYAEEALQLGIVQRVYPKEELLEATLSYARDIAVNVPPSSMAAIKNQILSSQSTPMMEVVKQANRLMFQSFSAPEHKEGVKSYLEKRKPQFPPYDENHPLVKMSKEIRESKL
mmetsp:Transcript_74075/g.140950  ORF Transcript_74075/g.140950 Transcript_74075/m.140950 type:complete len:303 (+) Transcript_74075:42-950(+)